jgi:hypothetical protein
MKKIKMLLASAALSAVTATAASAVVIDFGLATNEPGLPAITLNEGGFTVTATAQGLNRNNVNVGSTGALVSQSGPGANGPNDGGLGVRQVGDTNQSVDGAINGDAGSDGFKDLLLLTFTKKVKITRISFSRVENSPKFGPDMASIFVDGLSIGPGMDISSFGWPAFMATGGWVGTSFGIAALGRTDDFKIRAIDVTPVPVPPAALLLATGVAGIGALARRKNKKA